jgi:hypothetical protein
MSKSTSDLFFVTKCIKQVFSQFRDIRLALNHACICWRILLTSFLKFIVSGFEMIVLVSSAIKTILLLLFVKRGKSFMYRRKSKGPSTDTWGIPWVILPQPKIEAE